MIAKTLQAASVFSVMLIAAACSGNPGASAGDASKGAATAAGPTNDPATRAAIDSADAKFVAAFKAADAASAAAFYEQDATSMPPNMEPESGRAAIEKGFTDLFKTLGKVDDFAGQPKELDIYPDHAIEVGTYTMSFTPSGSKTGMKDRGSFINYWRKQSDGSWKIHRDAIVSSNPLPGMTPLPAKK